jgi:outer membrane protein TolC/Flp pilus assembly protein TadD
LKRHVGRIVLLVVGIYAFFSPFSLVSETQRQTKNAVSSSHNSSYVSSQIRKGKVAYRQKNYQLAFDEWKKAEEQDPHNDEIRHLLGLVQEKVGVAAEQAADVPEADIYKVEIPAHKKASFVKSQIREGKIAYRKKNYEKAFVELKKAQYVDSKNEEVRQLIDAVLEKDPDVEKRVLASSEHETPSEPQESTSEPVAGIQTEEISQPLPQEEVRYDEDDAASKVYSASDLEEIPLIGLSLTLEQCIMIARANNLSVKIAREEAALARWKMAPARRALWPSFDVLWKETRGTTTGQDFTGREITLEFQKPLITWGKTKALFLQAKINWEIAKRNLQKEVTELDFKVEQAYFILANALKDTQDLRQLYRDSIKDVQTAEKRYKMQLARELEYLKVKSKVDEVFYRVQSADKDLILAQLTLSQILDSRNEEPFTVRAKLGPYELDTTLEQCVETALKNRSDLLVNELLIEYNKLGQKVAKSEYKWNVNLEGSVGMNDEAFVSEDLELQNEYFVGVKVTKPFGPHTLEDNFLTQDKVPSVGQTTSTEFSSNTFKWYFWNSTAKISIKESDIKYLKSIDEYIKKRNSIIFEVKKNYYEYLKAKQQLRNNKQKIRVSEEELKISVARLGLNEILDSELIESKDRASRTRSEYGQALTGYYTAVANLNKSLGLTDYFDLKRGVQDMSNGGISDAWQKYLNSPGEIGSLPSTDGYKEAIERLEGRKPWWKVFGGSKNSKKNAEKPKTTQDLVDKLTDEGIDLYKHEKYQEALDKFKAAEQLDSDNLKVQSYLRKTKIKLGQEVQEDEKKYNFSSRSNEAEEWLETGISAYKKHHYEEAISALNKVLELDPSNRQAQVYRKRAQSKLSNTQSQNSK